MSWAPQGKQPSVPVPVPVPEQASPLLTACLCVIILILSPGEFFIDSRERGEKSGERETSTGERKGD